MLRLNGNFLYPTMPLQIVILFEIPDEPYHTKNYDDGTI